MRVLVACEFSGRVREAFHSLGHDAMSCDLLPSDLSGNHFVGDIRDLLERDADWDLMIAHPPCTYLARSGLHWNLRVPGRNLLTEYALQFVQYFFDVPIPRVALENPIGRISSRIRKPDQIIQPWQFGEDMTKATCLWLKGLPKLVPTEIILRERYANETIGGHNNVHDNPRRAMVRSITPQGVADAMAAQWG